MPVNDFKLLERLIKNMGISIEDQNREHLEAFEGGKDIDTLDQIISSRSEFLLDVSPLGEVRQIALFISQGSYKGHNLISNIDKRHKYHLFNCSTLQNCPLERKDRYKTTIDLDGKFPYKIIVDNKEYKPEERKEGRELHFCENCNKILQAKLGDYGSKSTFRIKDLMDDLSADKVSRATMVSGVGYDPAIGDVPRLYPKNWRKIARSQKEKFNWTCQSCDIDLHLSEHRQWLDAHHMDGNPSNSTIANIKVLCVECHANEIMHEHIRKTLRYKNFVDAKKKGVLRA